MKSVLLVCVVAVAALLGTVHSQTCPLPGADRLATLIAKFINSDGGEGSNNIIVTVVDFHFTCIAVSGTEDTLRFLSVAIVYNRNDSGAVTQLRQQFQFECSGDVLASSDEGALEMNPPAEAFTVATRRDCFVCAQTAPSDITFDAVTNCAICTNCQSTGQGFCTGSMVSDCCPFYQNGMCTTSCTGSNRTASAATNFTCVCEDGFVERNGECVDVCNPSPCLNDANCTFAGNTAVCNCQPGFTGATCDTEVVPEPSSTPTPTPSATPVTSPSARPCTIDNCRQCNSAGCCVQCDSMYELSGSISSCRTCVQIVCPNGCVANQCDNSTCCRTCQEGYRLVTSGNTCTCEEIRVSDPSAVAAGIAIGVVLFVLLLLALAILLIYVIYAAVTHGTDSKRTKSHMPFGNGDAHDNPLYINPKELDDDEP